jgi:hypothetical protein
MRSTSYVVTAELGMELVEMQRLLTEEKLKEITAGHERCL